MRRWFCVTLFVTHAWCASSKAEALEKGCFSAHLREAIAMNRERSDVYARLSDNESRALSRRLVLSEVLSLPLAFSLEVVAFFYWREGIPVLCEDFVLMSKTPPVQTHLIDKRPHLENFREVDMDSIITRIRKGFDKDGFVGAHAVLEHQIEILKKEPHFNCMTRHILESAARISWLAPQYDTIAVGKKHRGPAPSILSRIMFELHLQSLTLARDFDGRAAPLAADGINIICGDVPPIDIRPHLAL